MVTSTLTPSRPALWAQALLVAAEEYEQMAGYDQVTVLNNSCFDSEPGG